MNWVSTGEKNWKKRESERARERESKQARQVATHVEEKGNPRILTQARSLLCCAA